VIAKEAMANIGFMTRAAIKRFARISRPVPLNHIPIQIPIPTTNPMPSGPVRILPSTNQGASVNIFAQTNHKY